jgi:site-specific recombinase XerD
VIVEAAEAGRDLALLELLYGSGLRIQEAVGCLVTDVSLAERTLFVAKGKGNRQRIVPITPRAAMAIARYMAEGRRVLLEGRARRARTRKKAPSPALFLSTTGQPVMPQPWRERRLTPLLRAAKLPKGLTPHRLRHACAVHLLESGADILQISRLLGHERLETTAIYLSLAVGEVAKALRAAHPRERPERSSPGS